MKKGEIYTATIERVDFPNKGIAHVDDSTCTIKNAIPGQKIEFMVSKKHGDRVEGRTLNIIEKSSNEIESPCPHFGVCGGCVYMSLPYEDQKKLKANQVKRLLDTALKSQESEWVFEGIKGSPKPYEYRNKMEFSFGDSYKDGPLALGMHKRGSFYDIENVYDCQIIDEDYRNILKLTREYFKDVPFFHKQSHEGFLRHLLVRKAAKTGQILIALVTSSQIPEGMDENFINGWKDELLKLIPDKDINKTDDVKAADGCVGDCDKNDTSVTKNQESGSIKGILHIINDSVADVVKADETHVLYGDEYIKEELLGLEFKISTFSFFQTNSLGAEVLYSTAREYIGELDKGKESIVYDLYSGTGTIAQMIAPVAKKVIGVEIIEEAVEAARENAKLNGLDNCEFIANDVLKALDDIEEKPDFIILDPPRDGVHPKALKKILDYGIERLIYISCKPTSLCRDLEMILESGYVVTKACCVDMFPFTTGIETVVLLNNKFAKAKDFVQIGIDAEDYYRIKDAKRNE